MRCILKAVKNVNTNILKQSAAGKHLNMSTRVWQLSAGNGIGNYEYDAFLMTSCLLSMCVNIILKFNKCEYNFNYN